MARVWPTHKAALPNARQRNLSLKLNEESKGTYANTEVYCLSYSAPGASYASMLKLSGFIV
jgi:hypothetical protein